jgi:glycosyltransferase involved in cell wall biosynthesis
MKLFIHAPNVHQGGGAVLLMSLLEGASTLPFGAQLDERLHISISSGNAEILRVRPTLWSRLLAEWYLRKLTAEDKLICFGNLPPLFGSPAEVFVFIQNRLLIDYCSLGDNPWRTRLRLYIERWWVRHRATNRIQFIVQTASMAQLITETLGTNAWIMPFGPTMPQVDVKKNINMFDFVYVASGEAHKNHKKLVEAWCILRENGLRPSLVLTISIETEPDLAEWIRAQSEQRDLHIELRGMQDREKLQELYLHTRCQIYPSLLESYGLPLVEAVSIGIPIIASERDFVRDVCTPIQTFDPESALSISRAVMRFLGTPDLPHRQLTSMEFLTRLCVESPQ